MRAVVEIEEAKRSEKEVSKREVMVRLKDRVKEEGRDA